jgi:hypothetical protein
MQSLEVTDNFRKEMQPRIAYIYAKSFSFIQSYRKFFTGLKQQKVEDNS